jgi:prepilin-type processing-associated H-X9-DG protein
LESLWLATAFALPAMMVYLILRRSSPATGAMAAGSSLVVMAMVSILAFCPWPRWVSDTSIEMLRLAMVNTSPERDARGRIELPAAPPERAGAGQFRAAEGITREPFSPRKPTFTFVLLQTLSQEWWTAATAHNRASWSWRTWLALAMLGSTTLGMVRLISGLRAIRHLRAHSEPLVDSALIDTVALLRAEMSCAHPVEVRSSAELATAATIGWRRALILLPLDWQTWNDQERRAVLAHELAHVCRGDFLASLFAQLSVALQFYHPPAHWFSARLRLDQELAADAWLARLAGGPLSYVTTLAQLALRRDDRALSWPARAFLPSRGTFVRRIEMLRDSKRVRHVGLSAPVRYLTVVFFGALGVLIAGLRAPIAAPPVLAQATKADPDAVSKPANNSFELSYLPTDTTMFVAIQPAALLGGPDWQPVLNLLDTNQPLRERFLLPFDEIEQLLLFWEGTPSKPENPGTRPLLPPPTGVFIRSRKPQEWKIVLNHAARMAEQVRYTGQTYWRPTGKSPTSASLCIYAPNDRTAIMGAEDVIRIMIEDRNEPKARHSWDETWSQLATGQINAALDTRSMRRRLNQGGIRLDAFAPLVEKTKANALKINVDRELTTEVLATVGEATDVKPVTETTQALLTVSRNTVASLREHAAVAGPFREANEWALTTFATLIDKARLDANGRMVRLQTSSPVDVAHLAQITLALLGTAQGEATQAQSVNHLKQIGLAFHTFADSRNHLPPSVLYGGKSGKVPHSWRVALLPYLEQQELYNSYNFDEPWDGPQNSKLLDRMPAVYAYPRLVGASKTHTAYFVFTGKEALLGSGSNPVIADITDGMHRTILAVEAHREVPWTKPEDIPFDATNPLPQIGGFTPDGANVLFGDGSVKYIKKTISQDLLKALITRAGGEVVSSDQY